MFFEEEKPVRYSVDVKGIFDISSYLFDI